MIYISDEYVYGAANNRCYHIRKLPFLNGSYEICLQTHGTKTSITYILGFSFDTRSQRSIEYIFYNVTSKCSNIRISHIRISSIIHKNSVLPPSKHP